MNGWLTSNFQCCFDPLRGKRWLSLYAQAFESLAQWLKTIDILGLEPHQLEWQNLNPDSWVARNNYRSGSYPITNHLFQTYLADNKGQYGRLDGKAHFPTTVTNMDPTAKQSKVLHPHVRLHLICFIWMIYDQRSVVEWSRCASWPGRKGFRITLFLKP